MKSIMQKNNLDTVISADNESHLSWIENNGKRFLIHVKSEYSNCLSQDFALAAESVRIYTG